MSSVTIPRGKCDPGYRYTMPRLQARVEGRGNGVRTNVLNMGDIARALKRPPMYVTKFFGCELGAIAKFMDDEEKALVNGSFTEREMDDVLDKFIHTYVLCTICGLPETDIFVKKNLLYAQCNACGKVGLLNNEHKACSYMLKNPPNDSTSTMGKKNSKKTKDEKRAEKLAKQRGTPEAKDVKKSTSKKSSKKDKNDEDAEPDEIIPEMIVGDAEFEEVVQRIRAIMANVTDADAGNTQKVAHELRNLQIAQDFDSICAVAALLAACFPLDQEDFSVEKLDVFPDYLKAFLARKKVKPPLILKGLEIFALKHNDPNVAQNFPYALQKLYKEDIVDAEDILQHYAETPEPDPENTPTDSDTLKAFLKFQIVVQPFLDWLKDCESESSDADDEDDDNDE